MVSGCCLPLPLGVMAVLVAGARLVSDADVRPVCLRFGVG
jgi:hypothetical protein